MENYSTPKKECQEYDKIRDKKFCVLELFLQRKEIFLL